jgi:hypothetical protein
MSVSNDSARTDTVNNGRALAFVIIAVVLSGFANSRCYLVDIDEDSLMRLIRPEPDSVGLWCFEATNGFKYDITNRNLGRKMDAARVLGTITSVLGFCIWIFCSVAACVRVDPGQFRLIGKLCILNCLFQGLVFLVFKSEVCDGDDRGCSLGIGGKCGVSAIVFWLVASNFSYAAGKQKDDDAPVIVNMGSVTELVTVTDIQNDT